MSPAKPPAPSNIRRATLTQSDAKLYAMTQVICDVRLPKGVPFRYFTCGGLLTTCPWVKTNNTKPASVAPALLQGLVAMMNTPNSAPSSALQSIGTVCWPFQKGMLAPKRQPHWLMGDAPAPPSME